MVTSANGEKVPVRLETKKISERDADHIIDNILLNSELEGNDKAAIIKSIVGTIANHNIEDSENANGPLFFANNREIKLRVGGQILSIGFYDFGDKGINNLRQALNGEKFLATVYQSSTGNPEYNYGEPLLNDDGKPKQEYFDANSPKTLTPEMFEALQNVRQVIKDAIMGKSYDVSKKNIVSNAATIDHTTGETYNSYSEYLEGKNILTTDVTGLSTGQKFTNSKAQLIPINKKIQIVTPSVKVTSDVDTTGVSDDIDINEENKKRELEAFNKTIEPEYEEGDYIKVKTLAFKQVNQGKKGVVAPDTSNPETLQLLTNYPKFFEEAIKALNAKQKTLDAFNQEKVLAGEENLVPIYGIKASINNATGRLDIEWVIEDYIDSTNKREIELGDYTFSQLVNYRSIIEDKYNSQTNEDNVSKNESNTDGEATPANIETVSETDEIVLSDPTQE
jgi:hypothetical protein